jgi:serine/threonine-protein kinase
MLTGRPPFEATAAAEVLAMQINRQPPSPREVAPHIEITEGAERVILRAMSKAPDKRHQSMDEFRAELQKCYGSIAYKRHATSVAGVPTGPAARRKRLTEELDDWLRSDQSSLTLDEARQLAMEIASEPEYDTGDEAELEADD